MINEVESKSQISRIQWLDAVKGIGILLVMVSHLYTLPHVLIDGYMPLFFIAAGVTFKRRVISNNIIGKAKRLLIPYFFYSVMVILYNVLYLIIKGGIDVNKLGLSLFGVFYSRITTVYPYTKDSVRLLEQNAPMWFLPCMFMSYLYYMLYCENSRRYIVNVLCTVALLFAVQNIPYQLPWSIDLALMAVLFICIGNKFGTLIINLPPRLFMGKNVY